MKTTSATEWFFCIFIIVRIENKLTMNSKIAFITGATLGYYKTSFYTKR